MASENKTKPTTESVADFLELLVPAKKQDAEQLIDMMTSISGQPPVLWGPSIIGFGSESYETAAGRSGAVPQLAFSPRKTALTVYFYRDFTDEMAEELSKLGKYRASVSCLYINKLPDIKLGVLESMLKRVWQQSLESNSQD